MTTAEQIQAEYAPRLAAAAARDVAAMAEADTRRIGAVLDVPHEVCGIPLRAMTLVDYSALIVAKNPHVCAIPEPEDEDARRSFWASNNLALLWLLSPDYVAGDPPAVEAFAIKHADLSLLEVTIGIAEYLADTFADAPRPRGGEEGEMKRPDPVRAGFPVYWLHRIACTYGWTREEIRALPLKELFQHLSIIEAEALMKTSGRLPPFTDGEYRPLVSEMLQKMNEANQAA